MLVVPPALMQNEDYVTRLRAWLTTTSLLDEAFDATLPPVVRAKSSRFWTPLSVVRRAADLFAEHGCRRVLDVGSGPGKFCLVAGAVQPTLSVLGIEQRAPLVDTANELRRLLRVSNVGFKLGDALAAPWHGFDGLYFYNPFVENRTEREATFDRGAKSRARFRTELLRLAHRLACMPVGVVIVTYHGLGGAIPSSYDTLSDEPAGSGRLRLWRKNRAVEENWFHLEDCDGSTRVSRAHFMRIAAGHG